MMTRKKLPLYILSGNVEILHTDFALGLGIKLEVPPLIKPAILSDT